MFDVWLGEMELTALTLLLSVFLLLPLQLLLCFQGQEPAPTSAAGHPVLPSGWDLPSPGPLHPQMRRIGLHIPGPVCRIYADLLRHRLAHLGNPSNENEIAFPARQNTACEWIFTGGFLFGFG